MDEGQVWLETWGMEQGQGGSSGVTVAHSEAHRGLQSCSWPGLAADMVEGKKEVMVLSHTGRKS